MFTLQCICYTWDASSPYTLQHLENLEVLFRGLKEKLLLDTGYIYKN